MTIEAPGRQSVHRAYRGGADNSLHLQLLGMWTWAARPAEGVAVAPDPLVGDCNQIQIQNNNNNNNEL